MEPKNGKSQPIDIPDEYLCPITRELMENPVLAADGHSYEKSAIAEWLQRGKALSPLTGKQLAHTMLTDNFTLKKAIHRYTEEFPQALKVPVQLNENDAQTLYQLIQAGWTKQQILTDFPEFEDVDIDEKIQTKKQPINNKPEEIIKNLILSITQTYQIRLENLTATLQSLDKGHLPHHLNSFCLFLKAEETSYELVKWYVLDTTLQDHFPNENYTLRKLTKQKDLLVILQKGLAALGKQYVIKNLVLSKTDEHELYARMVEYRDQLVGVVITGFIFEKAIQEKWLDVLSGINMLRNKSYLEDSFFRKIMTNIADILSLYLVLKLEFNITSQNFEEVELISKTLFGLVKGVLTQDQPHTKQVMAIVLYLNARAIDKSSHQEQSEAFNSFVSKMLKEAHSSVELTKTIGDYKSAALERTISEIWTGGVKSYRWKEICEDSPVSLLKNEFERFIAAFKATVSFHNHIYQKNTFLLREDRLKNNYYFKE